MVLGFKADTLIRLLIEYGNRPLLVMASDCCNKDAIVEVIPSLVGLGAYIGIAT